MKKNKTVVNEIIASCDNLDHTDVFLEAEPLICRICKVTAKPCGTISSFTE